MGNGASSANKFKLTILGDKQMFDERNENKYSFWSKNVSSMENALNKVDFAKANENAQQMKGIGPFFSNKNTAAVGAAITNSLMEKVASLQVKGFSAAPAA
ncbi:MAG: hypothetical protein K0R48_622 [Gammaproteobacteria bacterium]|jgi:hypothetical protein|nr:hypothetical protein [Gammaproteobacteria bacterium]